MFDDHVRTTGFVLGDDPETDSPSIVKYYYVKTLPASAGFVYDGYLAEPGLHQCIQIDQVEGRYL